MERVAVQSTNLSSVGYDETESTLEIEFHHGGIYQYARVPAHVHASLMSASSKGSYFAQNIKSAGYPYKKIR